MDLYTTPLDFCPMGCGTPLVLLYSSLKDKLLLCCTFCEGMWDHHGVLADPSKTYDPSRFCADEITIAAREDLLRHPQQGIEIATCSGGDRDYYLGRVREMFGDKMKAMADQTGRESFCDGPASAQFKE